jgi:hypothetical protein
MEGKRVIETHYRACHLCEAICGLKIETRARKSCPSRAIPTTP